MPVDNKKYYWIKLKTDFFSINEIDFLLSQKNGCEYIVLYQMLCLNTANSDGRLQTSVGELLVPYNAEKIARDTKHFDVDTIVVALELFKKLGLIYEEENKILKLTNFEKMIGSASDNFNAKRQAKFREKKKEKALLNVTNNNASNVTNNNEEYKRLEIRDIDNKILDNSYITNTTIYNYLEQNFGRPITPIEYEKLNCWLSSYDENILKYAIEISVFSQKKTFNYINGILNNWKSKGYKTIQEIKDNELKLKSNDNTPAPELFDYNWLDDEADNG